MTRSCMLSSVRAQLAEKLRRGDAARRRSRCGDENAPARPAQRVLESAALAFVVLFRGLRADHVIVELCRARRARVADVLFGNHPETRAEEKCVGHVPSRKFSRVRSGYDDVLELTTRSEEQRSELQSR